MHSFHQHRLSAQWGILSRKNCTGKETKQRTHVLSQGQHHDHAGGPTNMQSPAKAVLSVLRAIDKQILPFALISFILLGVIRPQEGLRAYELGLSNLITIAIFVISGLQLKRGDALAAAKSTGCVTFGLVSILLLTPLLAYVLLRLPLPDHSLPIALGAAVFCCMPTTLSSGISMTAAVGGNTALAILLTLASNILGVFTMPLVLPVLLGSAVGGSSSSGLQPGPLLAQLTKVVLLPTLLGAAARAFVPGVAAAVDGNRRVVVYLSAICLACVPWMQVSRSVCQGLAITAADLCLAVCLGSTCHVAFLAFNALCVRVLSLGGQDRLEAARLRQALVLQASQKTLPVAVAVISSMTPSLPSDAACAAAQTGGMLASPGAAGLAAIAAVTCHLTQIIIDSFLVPVWTKDLQSLKVQQATN